MTEKPDPFTVPFGSILCDWMTTASAEEGPFVYRGSPEPFGDLSISPAAHVLHYGSAIFEGLKAHRQVDGSVAIFRLDSHVARMVTSASRLRLPEIDPSLLHQMIVDAVAANADEVPDPPGSLYIRPTLIGTGADIGAAAHPASSALLFVVNSPVGDYFKGGIRPLTLQLETSTPRTVPQFGMVKCGANYAMALGPTLDAMAGNEAIDQVLFATEGDITETGASNFFLADDERIVTRHLDESFLHGVTRDSVIQLARHLGYEVEERSIDPEELVDWSERGEAFLSGTAAGVAPVGTILYSGKTLTIGTGQPGPNTLRLRQALTDAQTGAAPDTFVWRTPVGSQ
ncbi:MAG: branched-chain-amino-acid transaminase [Acidimicrobiia bacterium]|nr:branched-chain-amino-acid transaminase [Acidimicrobiia bacterium]MYG58084.1 branched-chain-amino-acid transaminase [Acidimicrobiia bacterium]MYJ33011.1 branched-chain-amino-acid transaminase [Acidimicrobiia bacterium]